MSFNSGASLGSHSTVSQWARAAGAARESLLTWIGPLSRTSTTGLAGRAWDRRTGRVARTRHEVGAALGGAGMDDELAGAVIGRTRQGDLLCLSRRRRAQVGAGLGPGSGETGRGQRLALIAIAPLPKSLRHSRTVSSRTPQLETCRPCRPRPNHGRQRISKHVRWSTSRNLPSGVRADRRTRVAPD